VTATVPVPTKSSGDLLTSTLWNTYVAANLNKLLNQGHRKLTVAQFAALSGIEDGDEVYLEVDATNGVEWHLVYRSAEATYKWRFLGGPPMRSEVLTNEGLNNAAYTALTTAGPSITLPRAGDYDVAIESTSTSTSNSGQTYHSYDIGVVSAVDADAERHIESSGGNTAYSSLRASRRKAGLAAVALVSKYRTSSVPGYWENRRIIVQPVRIRHDA
jgi:hypothetical protein